MSVFPVVYNMVQETSNKHNDLIVEIYITLLQEEYLTGFDFGIGKKEKGIFWFNFLVLFMASGASFVP